MTLLPDDSRAAIARLDLEPYELPGVCQWPDCDVDHDLEDHHLWRRSFGKDFREAWWVELDELVIPNRIHLCPAHHLRVTDNEVRIRFAIDAITPSKTGFVFEVFEWENKTEGAWLGSLEPPAGPQGGASGRTPVSTEAEGRSAMQLTVDGGEVPHDEVCEHDEEEVCSTCKGTGKRKRRKKRKASSGTGSPRVIATRIPASEPKGFQTLSSLHDAAEAILVQLGILKERGNGAAYYRDTAVYAEFVTNHREELPDDWKQEEADDGDD